MSIFDKQKQLIIIETIQKNDPVISKLKRVTSKKIKLSSLYGGNVVEPKTKIALFNNITI